MRNTFTRVVINALMLFVTSSIGNFSLYPQAQIPTLTSDKENYAPATTVTFTSSGLQACRQVKLTVLRYDLTLGDGKDRRGT